MCLAIAGVVGVIAYRVSTLAALQLLEGDQIKPNTTIDETKHLLTKNASIITTITGACINLTIIILLNMVSIFPLFLYPDKQRQSKNEQKKKNLIHNNCHF